MMFIDNHSIRYKYLQKPLEERSLPALLQYSLKWPAAQREKLAVASGLLMAQDLANTACLLTLTKENLLKDGMKLFGKQGICRI